MVKHGVCGFVLPLEGIARTSGMVAGDRSCLCISGVVVADDPTVYGVGDGSRGDLFGPTVNNGLQTVW